MRVTVEIPRLRALIVARLGQVFGRAQAEQMADAVLFGELVGRSTHGIIRVLPGRKGAVDEEPGPTPTIRRTAPAAASIEGRPGMLVASMATDLAIELAIEHGFAVVTTRGSRSTSGSLTYYIDRLTSADLVGLVTANTLSFVTPPGGLARTLGTNPMGIGIPADPYPFIMDMATSATTFGDVVEARDSDASIPPGVAVDAGGRPTRDPVAVLEGGALLTFGGHKGLGLSMAVELLSGAIAGSDAGDVGPDDVWGHVFVAFSLGMIGDPEQVKARAQGVIDRIAATPTVDGVAPRIPGHRSLMARDRALASGVVEVDRASFDELVDLVGTGSP